MADAYAKKSGRPASEWLTIMNKNTRMNAQMLKSYGLADEVIQMNPTRIAAMAQELKEELKNLTDGSTHTV
jgi:ATP-dependent protease ClpP protease subunit